MVSDSIEDMPGDVELTVTGEFFDGTGFSGSDTVRVIQGGDDGEEDVNLIAGDQVSLPFLLRFFI